MTPPVSNAQMKCGTQQTNLYIVSAICNTIVNFFIIEKTKWEEASYIHEK